MIALLCLNIIITTLTIATTTSTVFSAIWLIIAFTNGALILILLEIEFIAILIIIVYIGAIAILFLFTIMMLNLNTTSHNSEETHIIPLSLILIILIINSSQTLNSNHNTSITVINNNNIETISNILYSEYAPWFLISSALLLISMIATITIISNEENSNTTNIFSQLQRNILQPSNLN